jgi:hypothetical protein
VRGASRIGATVRPSLPGWSRRARPSVLALLAFLAATLLWSGPGDIPRVQAQDKKTQAEKHAEHDRQKWDNQKKADEAAKRAKDFRKRMDDLIKSPCPKTKAEWDKAIDDVASWLAIVENKDTVKSSLPDQFKKPGNPAGKDYGDALEGRKKLGEALQKKLKECDPKESGYGTGGDIFQEVLQRAQKKLAIELGLIGLAPLEVGECEDCKAAKEKEKAKSGGGK